MIEHLISPVINVANEVQIKHGDINLNNRNNKKQEDGKLVCLLVLTLKNFILNQTAHILFFMLHNRKLHK